MPFTHPNQPPSAVYRPSRGDQRIVRTIIANLHDGEPSVDLENIVSGPLARTVRFLGALRGLTYLIVAQGRDGAAYSLCGPTAESAADVGRSALDLPLPHAIPPIPAPGCLSGGNEGRAVILRDAVERVVSALNDRDDCVFVLAWQVAGEPAVELDYSPRMRNEIARDWVRWFLSEKLHVESPSTLHRTTHLAGRLP
jgi:hypothetical protein